jgi:hypothetical protein
VEPLTLICDDRATSVEADLDGERLLIDPAQLALATDWTLKPEGLCRGAVCVPTSMWPELVDDGRIDLAVFARLTDHVVVADTVERAPPGAQRLPPITGDGDAAGSRLHGRHHRRRPVSLGDFKGRKKLLVAFSSWCGCRYDLPSWEQINRELAPRVCQ